MTHPTVCACLPALQKKLKGTELEGCVEQLFSGSALTTLQCVNVEYQGTPRIEALFDIQLDVDVRASDGGCPAAVVCLTSLHFSCCEQELPDVEASLQKYCSPTMLTGDNQYETPDDGKQVPIHSHPNVLQQCSSSRAPPTPTHTPRMLR